MAGWMQVVKDEGFLQTVAVLADNVEVPVGVEAQVLAAEVRANDYIEACGNATPISEALRNLGHVAALRSFGIIAEQE